MHDAHQNVLFVLSLFTQGIRQKGLLSKTCVRNGIKDTVAYSEKLQQIERENERHNY